MGKEGTKVTTLSSKIPRRIKRRSLPTLPQEWTDSSLPASSLWISIHVLLLSHILIHTKKIPRKKFQPIAYHSTVESLPCSHSRIHEACTVYRATPAQEPQKEASDCKLKSYILNEDLLPAYFLLSFCIQEKSLDHAHTHVKTPNQRFGFKDVALNIRHIIALGFGTSCISNHWNKLKELGYR